MQQNIPWSGETFLRWSDFKAEPNPAAFADASSTIKYRATWRVSSEGAGGEILFFISGIDVVTEFLPHLSWVREMHATKKLLKHEQGQFDLAELLRRDHVAGVMDTLREKRYPVSGKNEEQQKQFAREHTGALVAGKLDECQGLLDEERAEYDRQTDFGQGAGAQSAYDARFAQMRAGT